MERGSSVVTRMGALECGTSNRRRLSKNGLTRRVSLRLPSRRMISSLRLVVGWCLFTPWRGHRSTIPSRSARLFGVSLSPDSKKLACATRPDVYVYDVDSGTLILKLGPLQGHEHCVRCVLWSCDGSRLFSGSDDETIRCWNTDTGEQIGRPWTGHTNWISSLSLSPDGSILASSSLDETVRFWDSTSGHGIGQDLQHDDDVNAVCFSPSGEFVASATGDGMIYLWPVPRLDPVESPAGHATNLNSILPDLSLALDERQRIFEVRLRKLLDLATSKGFHVSRDLFPPSLPVGARSAPLSGIERIADGNSNAMSGYLHNHKFESSPDLHHFSTGMLLRWNRRRLLSPVQSPMGTLKRPTRSTKPNENSSICFVSHLGNVFNVQPITNVCR
ncbi:WD40 repeat-like protein [Imleria badia]|nr:WD40 repeat-like protein [Imleria badia]